MISQNFSRFLSVLSALMIAMLAFGAQSVSALPVAPAPVSPAAGSTIIIPTFTWHAVSAAAKYEVEVGPQSDPNTVYWSGQTANLTLTPNNAFKFANAPLYWRVRGLDSGGSPGAWSSKVSFTKHIPAPTLLSPANGSSLVTPVFEWQAAQGAAYYKVELSASSNFLVVDDTYFTYNTRYIPSDTISHGLHYWRVSGVDADDQAGTPSTIWSFTKDIPAPALTSPFDGHNNIHVPVYEWQTVQGAAYYKVELSPSPTFVPVEETYFSYNSRLTPLDSIPHGLHYWRVSSVDADGHVGTPGAGWTFTKTTDAPVLVSPGVNATITTPNMQWQAVEGAAYYKVELSASSDFVPVLVTYLTYNLEITPVNELAVGTYYWRVSGVDAAGHAGNYNWRRFTLDALPAPVDAVPLLLAPAHGATITTDPTFSWSRVVGAADYRLRVSEYADFHATYESIITDYASYTPYNAGTHDAYPNGVYYWKVDARNSSGVVIATSEARSFTKQEALPLIAPTDGAAGLVVDATFQWTQIVGAKTYRLRVSEYADFHATYENIITDFTSYTPYAAGSYEAYPNGTYYWMVEARNSAGVILATSEARSFTKQEPMPLSAPADGAAGLLVDPTFQWSQIVGAETYRLRVSEYADFHATYENVVTDATGYVPSEPGTQDAYPNGTYYWKVEARNSNGVIIATSEARSFTKQESITLAAPSNGYARLTSDPTFQWNAVVGAETYHLIVSKYADFHATYDSVYCDYLVYTPYNAGTISTYARGSYYWKVEARNSAGVVITTSNVWSFSKAYLLYLPVTIKHGP